MPLNHLNLAVSNVGQTQQLLEKYFGLAVLTSSPALAVLTDEHGFTLTLSNFKKDTEVVYPADFHIGFVQQTVGQVNELYHRLTTDGFVLDAPRKFHGFWTFYWREPGGLLIEVLCFTSAG